MSKHHCQQFELYAAEQTTTRGRTFVAPVDLQAWVDELRDLPYWQRNFPQVLRVETHVRRTDKDGSVGGWYPEDGCGVIEMAPCHLTELYVLHELSHVLADARYGSHAHDPWFARTYLELVYHRLGSETYQELARVFDARGIDYAGDFSNPAGTPMGGAR
jgi:putative metallohydrolase (TIGR04338 family)